MLRYVLSHKTNKKNIFLNAKSEKARQTGSHLGSVANLQK